MVEELRARTADIVTRVDDFGVEVSILMRGIEGPPLSLVGYHIQRRQKEDDLTRQ